MNKPVILLIGGATGTGKSTVATEVAHRLGIHRVTSTDVVRETLRAFFAPEYMPSIHRSSFDAEPGEELVEAFLAQTKEVLVAVEAAVERARETGVPVIENSAVDGTVDAVIELVLGTTAGQLERV